MNTVLALTLLAIRIHKTTQQVLLTPVIGILTLHTAPKFEYPENTSYMYTSYSKWIEQSEMRWIPISVYEPIDVVLDKLRKVNGVLLTGGNEVMGTKDMPSQYAKVVKRILDYSVGQFNAGIEFPVFGICMGFEAMMVVLSDYEVQLEKVSNENKSLGLDFNPVLKNSHLNLYFSDKQIDAINTQKLFYFHHKDGFSMDQINKSQYITKNIKTLATVTTTNNLKILAVFQHNIYPFIAVQFHPEKVQFEYSDSAEINKSEYAMQVNSGFSRILRRMIGNVKAKLSNKEVLEFRMDTRLEVEYGAADEAFIFELKSTGVRKERRQLLGDETTPE